MMPDACAVSFPPSPFLCRWFLFVVCFATPLIPNMSDAIENDQGSCIAVHGLTLLHELNASSRFLCVFHLLWRSLNWLPHDLRETSASLQSCDPWTPVAVRRMTCLFCLCKFRNFFSKVENALVILFSIEIQKPVSPKETSHVLPCDLPRFKAAVVGPEIFFSLSVFFDPAF